MSTIQSITNAEYWFKDEYPSYAKFTSQVSRKIDTLASNDIIINNAMNLLLQGTSGAAEQAKTIFFMTASPNGWTRDLSISTDSVLRVTTGTGGTTGGAWSLTGTTFSTVSDHTHTLGAHIHDMGHTHLTAGHFHTMGNHSHAIASHSHSLSSTSSDTTSFTGSTSAHIQSGGSSLASGTHAHNEVSFGGHSHTTTATSLSTSGSSTNNTATNILTIDNIVSPASAVPSTDITSAGGSHTHIVSGDATWRPLYVTSIVCTKD